MIPWFYEYTAGGILSPEKDSVEKKEKKIESMLSCI